MSKKNGATVDILKAELSKTPEKHGLYAGNAMRPAILQRAIDGGKRAVRKSDAEESGVRPEEFEEWKKNVGDLYEAACDFYEALGTDGESKAEAYCNEVWARILKAGEENVLIPKMYIRPSDAHNMRVWACEIETKTVRGIGTVGVYTGLDKFRGIVETRIALRIAGNAILKDDDRDVIDTYVKACKAVESANKTLNGYTEGKTTVSSIDAQIVDAQNVLDQVVEALTAAGVEDVERLTGRQKAAVTELKDVKAKAEKKLKKWAKVKDDLQDKYDKIVDKLDSIEGITEDTTPAAETEAERVASFEAAREAAKAAADAK